MKSWIVYSNLNFSRTSIPKGAGHPPALYRQFKATKNHSAQNNQKNYAGIMRNPIPRFSPASFSLLHSLHVHSFMRIAPKSQDPSSDDNINLTQEGP